MKLSANKEESREIVTVFRSSQITGKEESREIVTVFRCSQITGKEESREMVTVFRSSQITGVLVLWLSVRLVVGRLSFDSIFKLNQNA